MFKWFWTIFSLGARDGFQNHDKVYFTTNCLCLLLRCFLFRTNFIPSGGLALPYFAGLFYQVRFHDGGEWHGGAPRTRWHWSCASTFGKNPWKTPNVEYYTLTKVGSVPKTVQDAYLKVLGKRKEDVNFKKQVICSMHWSCGKRLNLEDLPSVKFTEVGN